MQQFDQPSVSTSMIPSRLRLMVTTFAWMLAGVLFVACVRREEPSDLPAPQPTKTKATKQTSAATNSSSAALSPKAVENANRPSPETKAKEEKQPQIVYSANHDEEIKAIFDLAGKGRWEEAEARVNGLWARDPQDQSVGRLRKWVEEERARQRSQALEDKIREVDAKNSVFNPTFKDLFTDQKDRGLPPRKDVRDAVDAIESTPYIPPSYGKTNTAKGLLFDFESRQGRMAKVLEREISVALDNATLESIIFKIGQEEGINFVADKSLEAFQKKLSVNMGRVKLSNFLRYISRNLDLQFQVGEDLIWVVDGKDPKKAMEETRFYRLRKGFVLPAQFGPPEVVTTRTVANNVQTITEQQKINKFVNDLAPTMPSLERVLTNFFTGSKMFIDYEHNLIMARGKPDELEVVERIIEEFDKSIQQVLIEAKFITISESAFLRLGATWGAGRPPGSEAVSDQTGLAFLGVAPGFNYTITNVFGVNDLYTTLTATEQTGESQVLSAPRLTLINNLPATISDGKVQYYYEEYQVKSTILEQRSTSALVPSGRPTKITSGAELDVLASIGGDGRTIFLALNPRVNSDVQLVPFATITDYNSAGNPVSTFDIRLPQYRTQELATRVNVRSGETVVMGGVLERTQVKYVESVPILGNLPIIGAAFRRRTELDRPRYLLIFVTATVLDEDGQFILYDEPATNPGGASGTGASSLNSFK